jgi:hypothetical protein
MDIADALTETVWTPGDQPELDAQATSVTEVWKPDRLWAAYLPGPELLMSARYRPGDEDFEPFSRYLKRLQPTSLEDCLFAVDSYYQSRLARRPLPGRAPLGFTPDPLADEVLAASNGILLWQRQLETLVETFLGSRTEAIRLRRHVNQKRPSVPGRLGAMTLPSGQSMWDLVEERLLYGGAVPGQWQGARRLWAAVRGASSW